ncbi:MAG: hypothetical protein AUJ75_03565 [Candidatus Omnitrophica bacterium CG1_02_49_10]|nr:MAG: hypothetical protein AUJ75_03565 [Candidatus Omnitrophica bacterium CG1_02_49_10]
MAPSRPGVNSIKAEDFDLNATLSCGQVFRWRIHDGRWYGLIDNAAIRIRQIGKRIEYSSSRPIEPERIRGYFNLGVDLDGILKSIDKDKHIHKAISGFRGLRIIRQEPAECLISYILSSNNNIPRINTLIERMSACFGERNEKLNGVSFHTFPTLKRLSSECEDGLKACGAGFRVPYVKETARKVSSEKGFFDRLKGLGYEAAKESLIGLKGVGDKIADCVLLFSLGKNEAFPVDVWIKRAVDEFYFKGKKSTLRDCASFGREHFGEYAGYAQEYLYCYIRSQKFQ